MRALEALILSVVIAACGSSNPDPREPSVSAVQTSGFGGWVQVMTIYGEQIEGELISVDDGMVRVLQPRTNAIVSVSKPEISSGRLYRYTADSGFAGWGVLGTISTLSHGFWLVLSAPIWIIWSGVTSSSESSHVILELQPGDENWANVAKWARFPQGMPRGFAQPPPGVTTPVPSGSP